MRRNYLAIDEFQRDETERNFKLKPDLFEPYYGESLEVKSPVELTIRLLKFGGNEYNVRGLIRTSVSCECSRCLVEFEMPVEASFNNIYTQSVAEIEELDVEISEVDLDTSVVQNDRIDLIELVHEQLILQLPIKPLCRDDCKGLCPLCGQNLNVQQCDCVKQEGNPRFSPLQHFFSKAGESDE